MNIKDIDRDLKLSDWIWDYKLAPTKKVKTKKAPKKAKKPKKG